jgi:hypothetical protein
MNNNNTDGYGLTFDKVKDKKIKWLWKYKTAKPSIKNKNKAIGRHTGRKLSQNTKDKISAALTQRNYIPYGQLTMFDGLGESGKTTIALQMAADLSINGLSSLILSAEDDPGSQIKPKLIAMGADLKLITIGDKAWRLNKDGYTITGLISSKKIKLLIIDPLTSFLGVHEGANQLVRDVLQPLVELSRSMDFGIIGIRHLTKENVAMGSVAISNISRAGFRILKHPTEPNVRVLCPDKFSLACKPLPLKYTITNDQTINWLGTTHETIEQLLKPAFAPNKGRALLEAKQFLVDNLGNGETIAVSVIKTLCTKAGHSFPTLKRAKEDLGVETTWESGPIGKLYSWHIPGKAYDDVQAKLFGETFGCDAEGGQV